MSSPTHYTDSGISSAALDKKRRKGTMIRRMANSLFLLFLIIALVSSKKQGDFGIFTVCLKNNTILRFYCYYAECKSSPPFDCEFLLNGTSLGKVSDGSCRNSLQWPTDVTNYTCVLTRKTKDNRKETKTILYPSSNHNKLRPCSATTGIHLHQTPTFLWPLMAVRLWGILVTDRQLT